MPKNHVRKHRPVAYYEGASGWLEISKRPYPAVKQLYDTLAALIESAIGRFI